METSSCYVAQQQAARSEIDTSSYRRCRSSYFCSSRGAINEAHFVFAGLLVCLNDYWRSHARHRSIAWTNEVWWRRWYSCNAARRIAIFWRIPRSAAIPILLNPRLANFSNACLTRKLPGIIAFGWSVSNPWMDQFLHLLAVERFYRNGENAQLRMRQKLQTAWAVNEVKITILQYTQ